MNIVLLHVHTAIIKKCLSILFNDNEKRKEIIVTNINENICDIILIKSYYCYFKIFRL